MEGHAGCDISVDLAVVEVRVVLSDFEEVATVHLSCGVVLVRKVGLLHVHWLLDVPEGVVGHRPQDLLVQGGAQTFLVCLLQVLHVVVALALLEHGQFLVEHGIPLISGQVILLDLLHQDDSKFIFLLFQGTVNGLLVGVVLELLPEAGLVELTSEFLVSNFVHEGAVSVLLSTSQGVEDSLLKGTLLEFHFGCSDHGLWLVSLVRGEGLLVLVEGGVLLFTVGQEFLSGLLMVSNINVPHVVLDVLLVDLGNVVLDLSLV